MVHDDDQATIIRSNGNVHATEGESCTNLSGYHISYFEADGFIECTAHLGFIRTVYGSITRRIYHGKDIYERSSRRYHKNDESRHLHSRQS